MTINFGKTADDYRQHRQGFPPSFFERLATLGLTGPEVRALDLGTGTGTVARGLALAGCTVDAADIAPELMVQARELDQEAGVQVTYHTAPAESVPLSDASLDLVTAGQCWHWFDRHAAAEEVRRLLLPGGAVVIAHLDWIPLPGNIVASTEALIVQHNSAWDKDGGTGLYPAWLTDLGTAGFTDIETFSYDLPLVYTPEAWRGRIRASAGVAASLDAAAVEAFDRELATLLAENFPGAALPVPHRIWAVIARKPA